MAKSRSLLGNGKRYRKRKLKTEIAIRLTNTILRGLSMGSRLLLIFALAKLLEPSELGLFGLFLATVSFCVLILGADYYTYSQRELLAREPDEWAFVIYHQVLAQLILYIIILPTLMITFWFELLPREYLYWFYALLITEHISQEINRLLIAIHKQLFASWVLFIRMGSWVFIVLPIMYNYREYNNINTILFAWLMGSITATIVGGIAIKKYIHNWKTYPVNKRWILTGFKIGGLFLIATICFKGLLTFDRYAVESLSSTDVLGVYVFYIGIVMGVINILDPAVFSFLYPRMLQNYRKKDVTAYNNTFKELTVSTLLISVLLTGIAWVGAPYIIAWVDKPIYKEFPEAFVVLLLMGLVYGIGMIPHYALYAMRRDKWIAAAHISSLVIFFITLELLQFNTGILTVSVALLIAFSWIGVFKYIGYYVSTKQKKLLAY